MSIDTFTRAYIECAMWSSIDNSDPEMGGEPLDVNFSSTDLAPESRAAIEVDCADFYKHHESTWGSMWVEPYWTDEQAGHDFWLTRNGHGTGFWDRYYGEEPIGARQAGKILTDAAKAYGSVNLYVGDDGSIHHA
jgi:hypothetical protein